MKLAIIKMTALPINDFLAISVLNYSKLSWLLLFIIQQLMTNIMINIIS